MRDARPVSAGGFLWMGAGVAVAAVAVLYLRVPRGGPPPLPPELPEAFAPIPDDAPPFDWPARPSTPAGDAAPLGLGARPIAWWAFDKGCSPTTTPDFGEHELAARAFGDPRCQVDGAYLRGEGEHFEAPDAPALHLGRALTIAAWIMPANVRVAMTIARVGRAASSVALGVANGSFVLTLTTAGADGGDGGVAHELSAPGKGGAWAHVAGVWDGREMRLFVDGRRVSAAPFVGPLAPPSGAIDLGAGMSGILSDVRIYGVALTDDEVARLFAERRYR